MRYVLYRRERIPPRGRYTVARPLPKTAKRDGEHHESKEPPAGGGGSFGMLRREVKPRQRTFVGGTGRQLVEPDHGMVSTGDGWCREGWSHYSFIPSDNTRTALKSLTLVKVGPVTIWSPRT